MDSNTSPEPDCVPDDYVRHPRLGIGRVLRQEENSTLVIRFKGRPKTDVLFPFQLERLEARHPRASPICLEASHE